MSVSVNNPLCMGANNINLFSIFYIFYTVKQ